MSQSKPAEQPKPKVDRPAIDKQIKDRERAIKDNKIIKK